MNLTRRGLFGLLGRAAAAAGLARVVAATPAVAAPVAASPFVGQFSADPDGGIMYSTSYAFRKSMNWSPKLGFPWDRGHPEFDAWWARENARLAVERAAFRRRECLRHIDAQRRIRQSHPAARQFWGLP